MEERQFVFTCSGIANREDLLPNQIEIISIDYLTLSSSETSVYG